MWFAEDEGAVPEVPATPVLRESPSDVAADNRHALILCQWVYGSSSVWQGPTASAMLC